MMDCGSVLIVYCLEMLLEFVLCQQQRGSLSLASFVFHPTTSELRKLVSQPVILSPREMTNDFLPCQVTTVFRISANNIAPGVKFSWRMVFNYCGF
jgi:hypothetical protein